MINDNNSYTVLLEQREQLKKKLDDLISGANPDYVLRYVGAEISKQLEFVEKSIKNHPDHFKP